MRNSIVPHIAAATIIISASFGALQAADKYVYNPFTMKLDNIGTYANNSAAIRNALLHPAMPNLSSYYRRVANVSIEANRLNITPPAGAITDPLIDLGMSSSAIAGQYPKIAVFNSPWFNDDSGFGYSSYSFDYIAGIYTDHTFWRSGQELMRIDGMTGDLISQHQGMFTNLSASTIKANNIPLLTAHNLDTVQAHGGILPMVASHAALTTTAHGGIVSASQFSAYTSANKYPGDATKYMRADGTAQTLTAVGSGSGLTKTSNVTFNGLSTAYQRIATNNTGKVLQVGAATSDIASVNTRASLTANNNAIEAFILENINGGTASEMRFATKAVDAYLAFTTPSIGNTGTFFGTTKSTGHYLFGVGRQTAIGTFSSYPLLFGTNNAEVARFDTSGNFRIGGTTFGTSATKTLALSTGTPPSTSPADAIQMYSKDINAVAGYAGLHVRDEIGTVSIIGQTSSFPKLLGLGTTTPRNYATFDNASAAGGRGRGYTGSATNYVVVDSSLGIRLAGNAMNVNDVLFNFSPSITGTPATMKTFLTPVEAYEFLVGEQVTVHPQEMPHWWAESTTLGEFHVHWATGSSAYVPGDKVKWQFDVTCANMPAGATTYAFKPVHTFYAQYSTSTTIPARTHIYTSFGNYTATECNKIGAQVHGRLTRIAKNAGGTNPAGTFPVFGLQVGLHAYQNSLGSNGTGTKSATP